MGTLPLIRKKLPLSDSETVLLVCNHQRQLTVNHLFLDERMGSYDDIGIPILNPGINFPLFLCCLGTCEQNRTYAQIILPTHLKQCFIMLSGQNLRRRHETALPAVCGTHQQSQECQNGFSAAHIPLDKAVHGIFFLQIRFYLRPDTLLCACKPVRQAVQQSVRIRHLFQKLLHLPDLVLFLNLAQRKKKQEKFIEGEPSAGGNQILRVLRKMYFFQGLPQGNQLKFISDFLRKNFQPVPL